MNARLLMGLKLLKMMGSRLYFFSNGTKIAYFKSLGKIPDMREEFIILIIRESNSLLFSLSNQVGIGSYESKGIVKMNSYVGNYLPPQNKANLRDLKAATGL